MHICKTTKYVQSLLLILVDKRKFSCANNGDWQQTGERGTDSCRRRKIRLIESNAKMSSSKKLTNKGTLRQVFICLRPPPLLAFCLGWSSNFVGSECVQIQNVKLLQNMVSNRTRHHSPPPSHTLSEYTVL
jgi:hypothetical protein